MDAIYVRQSVDKIDSISIESQIDFCLYETHGNTYKIYQDKGYSGKNTERPQFNEMMHDIRKGNIKRIICYKLDRISRSVLDFSAMINELEKYNVAFISCTEKFDTSTPIGRAMLNICIVFAQLERETIQQRVTDSYLSRSRKGFFMGGPIPYGYELQPFFIDNKKTSCYKICNEEAQNVLLAYSLYSDPHYSYNDILQYFASHNIHNHRKENKCFSKSHLADMLRNPIYVKADLSIYLFFIKQGCEVHNSPEEFIGTNGCYLYSDQSSSRKHASLKHHHVVLAPHEGIVPADLWLHVREKCLSKSYAPKKSNNANTWLIGKIKCGKCGYALNIKKSNSKASRYFMCSRHLNYPNFCDGVGALYAYEIEEIILNSICEQLSILPVLSPAPDTISPCNSMINSLETKIELYNTEITKLMQKLGSADETLSFYIHARILELDSIIKQEQKKLNDIKNDTYKSNSSDTLANYMEKWKFLSMEDKINIVDLLISVIRVTETNIEITWKL